MKVDASLFSILLLVVAVALFLLAGLATRLSRGWMVPVGLAAFAGSFLVTALL